MTDKPYDNFDRSMLEDSLAFFGAITASVSHELNNVLSIIDQTGGLLDDLLYAAPEGKGIPPERLRTIVDKLANQTIRGVGIIKRLNYFSHSVDDPVKTLELPALVDIFSRLMQRLSGLKKVELVVQHQNSGLRVNSSPFFLQMLIYICIQNSLLNTKSGGNLKIATSESGNEAVIQIDRIAGENVLDQDFIKIIAGRIGGNVTVETVDGRECNIIRLPKHNSLT